MNGLKNGNGKEYNNDGEIEFEGEYLNGKKWNGNSIEYNNGYLEFEGEYKNGKRWNGIIKEYDWADDFIIFEGVIVNGEKIEN